MNEVELMEQHSATAHERAIWAMAGADDDFKRRVSENKNPNITPLRTLNVFHNRMLGLSDDGLRVIGKEAADLPGGSRFKEEAVK